MRTIKYTSKFKKDFKREKKSSPKTLERDLLKVVKLLAVNKALLKRHRDHSLVGDWDDHRDCHIRPDLVLIYRKLDKKYLELVRIGSHSELGI